MLPNFLIIGAPRAGTTWLAKNLRSHPEIFMPAKKEIHFFNRHFDAGTSWYEAHFAAAAGYPAAGEATPEYLYLPEVPERVHALVPDCKLILSLRDPVDRVYSRYWNSRVKFEDNKDLSFEEKLASKPLFLEEGRYFTHLTRYYRFFDPEQFLILLYDDIQERPMDILRRTFRFIGVDETFRPPIVADRINGAADKPGLAKSSTLYYAHRTASKLGLRNIARRIASFNSAGLPPMDPRTRRWLITEVYQEENTRLSELTGLDLTRWNC